MNNRDRAEYGRKAVEVGTPDHGQNGAGQEGAETDASDAVANILHHVRFKAGHANVVIRRALAAYNAEVYEENPDRFEREFETLREQVAAVPEGEDLPDDLLRYAIQFAREIGRLDASPDPRIAKYREWVQANGLPLK